MQTIQWVTDPVPTPDPTESLVSALLRFSRLARSWEFLEGAGMPKLQVAILIELARVEAERVTTLANRLDTEVSVVSRHLAVMCEAGTVARVRDPRDGRAWLVTVSDAGRQLLVELDARRCAWFSRRLAGFGDDELAAAARVMETVNAEWETVLRKRARQPHPQLVG